MNQIWMTGIKWSARLAVTGSFIWVTLLVPALLQGQQQDFQSWWEVELRKDIGNDLTLSAEVEQRFRNNSLQYDRSQFTLAGEYDIAPFLDISAGARALLASSRELELRTRYRFHLDLTAKTGISILDLNLRSRLQYGIDDLATIQDLAGNNLVNRNRLKADYHIFGTRLDLFIFLESFHHLSDGGPKLFYRMRYSAGAVYTLNFKSELGLRYILEDEFNVTNPLLAHILVIGYRLDL